MAFTDWTVQFRVVIQDPSGEASSNNVRVTVDDTANAAPVANPDESVASVGRQSLIDVLANDIDPDGDLLSVKDATLGSGGGDLSVSQSGSLSFTPTTAGDVTINYVVQDERGLTANGAATVSVQPATNLPPIARADLFEVQLGRSVELDLLANDIDPDGNQLQLVSIPASIASGSLTKTGNTVSFNPTQQGKQVFSYQVSDGSSSAKADVTVIVKAQVGNRPPLALPDRVSVAAGAEATVDVVRNDSDPDGDVLGVISWTAPPGVKITSLDGKHLTVPLNPRRRLLQ